MTQAFRTAAHGGGIHRDRPLRFTFDGRAYNGFEGDTLASALLANGVHLVARSFKYHRPRGILTAGSEEPNALVTIDRGGGRVTPNLRATTAELHDGLDARSQNAWPSLRSDLGALAGIASPVLSAGFYYKTFMWPVSYWRRYYEPAIRAAAGFGRAPTGPDPDRYMHQYAHCDVLVIGAGPAGLAAAKAAAAGGMRVILCDEQATPGGSLLSRAGTAIDGRTIPEWIADALTGPVQLLTRATAFGWYPDNMIAIAERLTDHLAKPGGDLPRERLWLVRAKRVVIATGAHERPMVFPNNDRPGIMLASAAATWLHRYGVLPGRRIVVTTSHDGAWHTALHIAAAGAQGRRGTGARVAAILDQRGTVDQSLLDLAKDAGVRVHLGASVRSSSGRKRVYAVQVKGGRPMIFCDTVLMSDGWTPSVHLFSQSRGKLRFDAYSGVFLPGVSRATEQSAGACAGTFDLAACLAEGHVAGGGTPRTFAVEHEPSPGLPLPPSAAPPHRRAFVDFQNDVTTKDLAVATQEGFRAIEHVKRYTTSGMGTDQGKTSNVNTLAAVAALTGRPVPEIGLTTFRPPYTPVTFGTFAGTARGTLFDPIRRTPIDDQDAIFEDVGMWKRARYFPMQGETMAQAVSRECLAVRNDVGMFDASTLGKIEVVGPDAAEFLNLMYPSNFVSLEPGRCKYGLMLGEDGFVMDDGVIARLAPGQFHVTTTTGGAAAVLHHMEDYLQSEFSALRVWLTSTTEHWACIALQGPRSADILAPFLDDIDLTTMPHLSVREGNFLGVTARVFRVSFTGELGFEINIPARFGRAAWDLLRETGAVGYGTEAMHVLRAEKGFIVIGQETDGTVIPDDLGLNWTISRVKPDFVGKRSLARPDMVRTGRRQLIGLLSDDPGVVLEEGAHLVGAGSVSLGHVTSAYFSETLKRPIALALAAGGRGRIGTQMRVQLLDRTVTATVVAPVFHDPAGKAMTRPMELSNGPRSSAVLHPTEGGLPKPRVCAGVTLTALPLARKFCLRTPEDRPDILRAEIRDGMTILWLGPNEALIIGETAPEIAAASLVDVSDRTAALRIEGVKAGWCLNAYCALDLHGFAEGSCTRTLFGKAEIVLWRLNETAFHIEVPRSLFSYVWACFEEALREFSPPLA